MKYLITKVEEKTTSTGKTMYTSTLRDDHGKEETVNLFDRVIEGQTVEGEIFTNDKGYRNFKSAVQQNKSSWAANQKAEQIEKAQDRKEASINRAMDRKEESIAWFNSRNLAITFVEKYVENPQVAGVADALEAVRKYTKIFFEDWKNWNDQPF